MNTFTRSSLLTVVIIILLLINSATILFILLRKPIAPNQIIKNSFITDHIEKRKIIPEELKFTADQSRRFELLREEHFSINNKIKTSINLIREELFSTISTQDTAKANKLIKQFATLHTLIETNTYNHFTSVRNICNKDQIPTLNKLLLDISRSFNGLPNGNPPQ